jgi:DNA-binding transcriptional ArsR family regulator
MGAAEAFDALGDPTRRAVFERLRDGPCSVAELAAPLPVSRPAVSRHLKVLQGAGLVTSRAVGRQNLYSVAPAGLTALQAWVTGLWDDALAALDAHVSAEPKNRRTQESETE